MNTFLFIFLLGGILLFSLVVGKSVGQTVKNTTDYYLSGRKIGVLNLALTFLAAQLGGGAIIGTADAAYQYQWQSLYYNLGISLGFFSLALGVGRKLREYQISTIPQIFHKVYQDKNLYIFATLIYVISTFLILVAVSVSARKYLSAINLESPIIFFVCWCTLIFYTSSGGLKAVVRIDVFQVLFVLIIFLITFVVVNTNPAISLELNINRNNLDSNLPWGSWLLMPMLFTIIGQDMGQRCFAGYSSKTVSIAAFLAGILLLLASFVPAFLGILAKSLNVPLEAHKSILIVVVSKVLNPYLAALFDFAVLLAIVSTANSLLCAISSNVMLDFFAMKASENTKNLFRAKAITFVIGLCAYAASYSTQAIIPLMVRAYELTIAGFFIPIFMAIVMGKTLKWSARISCFAGIICNLYLSIWECGYPREFLSIGASLLGYFIPSFYHLLSRDK